MPIRVYACKECGTFEHLHRNHRKRLERCPECGEEIEEQVTSSVAIAFKGSGFYSTDYAQK